MYYSWLLQYSTLVHEKTFIPGGEPWEDEYITAEDVKEQVMCVIELLWL